MEKWRSKVALVTGASYGIGREISFSLVKHGVKVVAIARNDDKLEILRKDCDAIEPNLLKPFVYDLSKTEEVEKLFDSISDQVGTVQILINNAGTYVYNEILKTPIDDLTYIYSLNVQAPLILMHKTISILKVKKLPGAIINMNSMITQYGVNNPSFNYYAATKKMLKSVTDAIRYEIAANKLPITVTSVLPNLVDTPLSRKLIENADKSATTILKSNDIALFVIEILDKAHRIQMIDVCVEAFRY